MARAVAIANSTSAAIWLRRTVVVLWIVAGSLVLLLLLSRMFAAAVPVPDSGGGVAPSYQYNPGGYYPGGGLGRIGQVGAPGTVQVLP